MKTSELTGPALDWAVAKCEDTLPVHNTIVAFRPFEPDMDEDEHFLCTADDDAHAREQCENAYPGCEIIGVFKCVVGKYSSRWDMAGPIIERECMEFDYDEATQIYTAANGIHAGQGRTHLIAAMRCFVASRLGDEVDIPEELQ